MQELSTKEKILITMYQLICDVGYDKASIGKLSTTLNISKPAIYHYFLNKEAILLELVDNIYGINVTKLEQSLLACHDKSSYQQLLINLPALINNQNTNLNKLQYFEAELHIQSLRNPKLDTILKANDKIILNYFKTVIKNVITNKYLANNLDIDLVSATLISMYFGLDYASLYDLPITINKTWQYHIESLIG